MNAPLNHATRVYAELKARLMADEGLAEDDQTLANTLEGATDLHEQIVSCVRQSREADEYAEGVKRLMASMKERRERWECRAARLRAHALWAMQEAGLPKITSPDLTISTRKNAPSISYRDGFEADQAPDGYRIDKIVSRFDTDAIRAALDAGENLDFAWLKNQEPSLSVRTK